MSEQNDRATFASIIRNWYKRSGKSWPMLAKEAGTSPQHLKRLAGGTGLASMRQTAILAELIPAPTLIDIMIRIRQRSCARCGAPFSTDGHRHHQRFCTPKCQDRAYYEMTREHTERGLRVELEAMAERVVDLTAAVNAFCWDCEPGGTCRMADCKIRGVSPHKFAVRRQA